MNDTITVHEAAELRGVRTEKIRHWLRSGWIKSARKAGSVWLMDRAEVEAFEPPKRGWQEGQARCPYCGEADSEGHVCDREQALKWLEYKVTRARERRERRS